MSIIKRLKLKNVVPALIGCIIILGMLWKIGPKKIMVSLWEADPYLLGGAFLLFLGAILFRLLRWVWIFTPVRPLDACKIFCIGQAVNEVAPIGSGELTRTYIAKNRLNVPIGETLTSAAIERILDTTLFIVMTVVCLTLVVPKTGYILQIVVPLIVLSVGCVVLAKPQLLDRVAFFFQKASKRKSFIGKFSERICRFLTSIKDAILRFHERKSVLLLTGILTGVVWSIEALGQYTILAALGIEVVPHVFYILAIICASWTIGLFSFLPGGLGVREVVFAVLLNGLGVPFDVGISAALIYRGMAYILNGTGALLSLSTLKT